MPTHIGASDDLDDLTPAIPGQLDTLRQFNRVLTQAEKIS
jgi:hypothetical protein